MITLSPSEIKAITSLLKTSDENTLKLLEEQFKIFENKLLKEIYNDIPLDDVNLQKQFFNIVLKIKRESLKKDFALWSKNNSKDLEEGIFLVALFDNPLIDRERYSDTLSKWANLLDTGLKKIKLKADPTSIINEVNHFFFMELGFKGNKEFYYDPENSFINKVMDKKSGNPILLSLVYLLVTNKLGLPFSPVNMPAHFLVKYDDLLEPIYIDPFSQGEIITRLNCQERIKVLKLPWQDEYLSVPTNKQIITRVIQNLINIYHNEGLFDLKECLEEYTKILK